MRGPVSSSLACKHLSLPLPFSAIVVPPRPHLSPESTPSPSVPPLGPCPLGGRPTASVLVTLPEVGRRPRCSAKGLLEVVELTACPHHVLRRALSCGFRSFQDTRVLACLFEEEKKVMTVTETEYLWQKRIMVPRLPW